MKRAYNTLRFWQAIISQLILPLLFVLFGLILAVTLPNANENDPIRALTVQNSGLDSSNRILFFAEFDDLESVFDFEVRPAAFSIISPYFVRAFSPPCVLCNYIFMIVTIIKCDVLVNYV